MRASPGVASAPANRVSTRWRDLSIALFLVAVLFAPVIYGMAREWVTDDDMGHGFFVPAVVGWILWRRRAELRAIPANPSWWGVPVVVYGLIQFAVGTLGVEFFLSRTALIITLAGTVIATCGIRLFTSLLFPFFLMLFMIRIPAIIYNQITFPLQLLASQVAESSLMTLGIPVLREGNVLELANQKLSVVEACSGIRSLLSLSFLALVYGYFFETKPWLRVVVWLLTIPIAIVANAGRVAMTGVLAATRPQLAAGFFHLFEGWVVFLIAMLLMVLCHHLINHVYRSFEAAKR
ncbi:MAG: exosortase [Bryobacterales bacterium]|nr:exosortase [Bryobacterales bacterium]